MSVGQVFHLHVLLERGLVSGGGSLLATINDTGGDSFSPSPILTNPEDTFNVYLITTTPSRVAKKLAGVYRVG